MSALRICRAIGRLTAALGVQAVAFSFARRRAVRGFRSGLADAGVPDPVARQLSEAFPRIGIRGLVGPLKGSHATGNRWQSPVRLTGDGG